MNEDLYDLGDADPVQTQKVVVGENITVPIADQALNLRNEDLQEVSFNYLGDNNRYFLIIVDDKTHTDLNPSHKEMLMKIMGAKKLELRDLAVLNLAKYPDSNFNQLKDFFSCTRIALFGIDPRTIGLPAMGANKPEKHLDVNVLATFGLGEMNSSTDKKKEFWNVMKDF